MAEEKYRTQLTGAQVDDALQQLNQRVAEGWAVGTRDGSPVGSGSEYYHNNAKYYAEVSGQAQADASAASDSAEAAAARAEAAVPAGTAGAVFFDRAQALTTVQQSQARTNIMAGGSNENILDNGWFKINQRQTSGTVTTNNTYVADRWVKGGSGGSVIIGSGDTLTPSGNGGFRQFNSLGKIISGETYTLSALVTGGTVYSKTGIFDSTSSSWQISGQMTDTSGQLWAGVRNNSGQLDVLVTGNGDITVNAMKFEKGPVSTLKNDFPPTYEYELDKCQWYFERIRTYNSYGFWGMGVATSATSANIIVPMHSKRVGGSYTVTKNGNMRLYSGAGSYTVTNIAKAGSPVSNVLHLVVTASGMTAGMPVMLTSNNDASAYIDVSADIWI